MRLLEDGDAGLRGGGQASSQSEDERDCHFLIGAPCVHEPLGMPNKGQTCWINVALQMMMRMGEVFTSPGGHGEKARTLLELVRARGPLSMTVRKRQTTNFLSSWGFRENVAGDAAQGFASIMNGLAGDSAAMATWCLRSCWRGSGQVRTGCETTQIPDVVRTTLTPNASHVGRLGLTQRSLLGPQRICVLGTRS